MLFEDIPGSAQIRSALIRSVQNNHVAHAQLFEGKTGGSALATALAYATYINCEDKSEHDACGRCASCIKTGKLVHPDVHMIFPIATSKLVNGNNSDAFLPVWRKFIAGTPYRTLPDWLEYIHADNKQGNIPVEESRNILKKLYLKSFEGEYKILIIWKPEILNVASANALLKILEEPPEKTLFLLVTDQADKLLTTIISRTQRIFIPALTDGQISAYLQQKCGTDAATAAEVAFVSDGNLAMALAMLGDRKNETHSWFAEWMRACFRNDITLLVRQAEEFDALSKENQKGLFDYTLRLFRDMFIWKEDIQSLLRVKDEQLGFVQNFSKTVDYPSLERMTREVNDAYFHIERNVRAKMVFLDLSLTLSMCFKR